MPREAHELYDAGNPEHVQEAKVVSKTREAQRLDGLKNILDNPQSRIWLFAVSEDSLLLPGPMTPRHLIAEC